MKKFENFFKCLSLTLLSISVAVVVGVFCVYSNRKESAKIPESPTTLVNTTYSGDDFASDTIIEGEDNYLKELGLSSGNAQNDFQLHISKYASSVLGADFTYSLDVNGNSLYEANVQGELNNLSDTSISINKKFNEGGNKTINFKIVPTKGQDCEGGSANAYYVSAIYLYTSLTDTFNDNQGSIRDCNSSKGKLNYPTTSIISGDLSFSFTYDNETGELDCKLTTLGKKEVLTNLKFSFQLSYRDNPASANALEVGNGSEIVSTSVVEGDYGISNSAPTFSVDDKLIIDIKPDSKIIKALTFYGLVAETGEYVEWFKIYGGVAGGVGNYAFTPGVTIKEKVISISNFALTFEYSENFLSGTVGKFTKTSDITNVGGDVIGAKIEVADEDKVDHRHKIAISLYDDGSVRIEKIGNECSLKLEVETQHYFVINLQEYSNGTSSSSKDPYESITVLSNSVPIISYSGDYLEKTTYIGVGESMYSLVLSVSLNNDYKWYREAINASYIVDELNYEETFYGGVKTLTAVSSKDKIFQLTISVEIAENEVAISNILRKSDLEIFIGETAEDERSCMGVGTTGIGSKSIRLAEEENSANFSYSVKLPYGVEIFKYSIDGVMTELETTLLEVENELITIEEDCNIVYYVKPIKMVDINVYNQEIDAENPIGKLQFYPILDTTSDLKINFALYYMNLSAGILSYSSFSTRNCPIKTGYKLTGLYDKDSLNEDKTKDNFLDSNYQFVGLEDYTGYPEWVTNVSSFLTYLYAEHKDDLNSFNIYCIFEPVTYTNYEIPADETVDENPSVAHERKKFEATYDDVYVYVESELYDATGHYVAGLYHETYGEILFDRYAEVVYDENFSSECKYRYTLQQPWNIAENYIIFKTLLKPITYRSTMVVAEVSKYYFATDDESTPDVDESILNYAVVRKDIDFKDSFTLDEIFKIYTDANPEAKYGLEGYDLIGYMPIAAPVGFEVLNDGALEKLNPEKEFYYIYDKIELEEVDVDVEEKMLRLGESYTWKYPRNVRFVPVYKLGKYELTLHAGAGNVFDADGKTEIVIEAKFNEELTEEFIEKNFKSIFKPIVGYDFGGYYYLDESSNQVLVVGGKKDIDKDTSTITYTATNIVKDAVGQFIQGVAYIQDFAYIYEGKMYWGVTRDLDLEIKFNKINYNVELKGKDAEGADADMSSQEIGIFEKTATGEPEQTGISTTYGEFVSSSKTVNIGNVLTFKNLGDEGTFVKKITIKYNTLFDEENYVTAYNFNYITNKNGKMTLVSENSDSAEKIYYNLADNTFYIDIEEFLNREKEKSNTIAIKNFLIEFEYDYRTFVVGFQTGAYSKELSQIVIPSTAEASYYLINYKTRNDYSSWIPCSSDGVPIEGYTSVWQDISFVHNYDFVTFEEGSLDRSQEIDIIIGTTSYFFCYWARSDADGNVEPLSWDWSEGNANVANSEDGGSLMYYSVFSKTADINVYYYTWDPVAKEETGLGYVATSQKGYFWFKENQDGSFRTVNSYERYKIGNHTYYITGWIWLEDNIADAGSFNQGVYYDKKNNMFVDSYTGSIIGSTNVPDTYHGLLERCTVPYRGNTGTDDTKIKIYCYAVYSLYDFEVVANADNTTFNIDMRVPNDFGGNSYTTDDLYWGAMSSSTYSSLLGKYLSIKDVINSGEIEVVTFTEATGKTSITSAEASALLSNQYDLLICYYSREVLSASQTIVVDALGIGTLTASGFEYNAFDKVGSYADGTLVGAVDEFIELSGTYMTAYVNAVNQMKLVGISGTEFNKRELILRITLQLLQWDAQYGASTTQGIRYSSGANTAGLEGTAINVESALNAMSSPQGGLILASTEGFVRLVYALAGYSINSEEPESAYGLFGTAGLNTGSSIASGTSLSSALKCGDIITWSDASTMAIWLYTFQDTSGNIYSVIANCRSITSDTELCGANRSCSVVDGSLVYTSGLFKYSYNQFISYCN